MDNAEHFELPDGKEEFPLGSGIVKGVIGSGGMAKVYKIWNPQLEVFRAVKLLIPGSKQSIRERFQTEVKITAKLHHPNIIEIHNVGEWNGMPFLEMEYIEGASLDEIINTNGPIPPAACTSIAILIARGLEYAHTIDLMLYGTVYKGVIHRDLKPANIMLTKKGVAKLMDFGIARPTETSLHTMEHNIVGTAQYLAPEQIDGKAVDCRTDIYALGAVLYEMLTGTKTFPQDTMTDLVRKKLSNEYRTFESFTVDVPKSLSSIVYKCLSKYMEDRYSTTKELLNDLNSAHRKISKRAPEDFLKTSIENTKIYSPDDFLKFKPENKCLESQKEDVLKWGEFNEAPFKKAKPANKHLKKELIIGICAGILIAVIGMFLFNHKPVVANKEAVKTVEQIQPVQTAPKQETTLNNEFGDLKQETPPNKEEIKAVPAAKPTEQLPSVEKVVTPPKKASIEASANTGNIVSTIKAVTIDNFVVGKAAYIKNEYETAVASLGKVDRTNKKYKEAVIMLIDAYTEMGKLNVAQTLIQNNPVDDAAFDVVKGKYLLKEDKNNEAIDLFQEALSTKSDYRKHHEIRNDAIYYSAIGYKKILVNNPTKDNKEICKQSWIVVKNAYQNTPNNPRYEKATLELENLD